MSQMDYFRALFTPEHCVLSVDHKGPHRSEESFYMEDALGDTQQLVASREWETS